MSQCIPLDQLMEFPSDFMFRVVLSAADGVHEQVVEVVTTALGREVLFFEAVDSSAGRFRSVRVTVRVESPDEVHRVYGALGALDGVRMLL